MMAKYMGAEGGARKWLEGGMTTKLPSYLTPEVKMSDNILHFVRLTKDNIGTSSIPQTLLFRIRSTDKLV